MILMEVLHQHVGWRPRAPRPSIHLDTRHIRPPCRYLSPRPNRPSCTSEVCFNTHSLVSYSRKRIWTRYRRYGSRFSNPRRRPTSPPSAQVPPSRHQSHRRIIELKLSTRSALALRLVTGGMYVPGISSRIAIGASESTIRFA